MPLWLVVLGVIAIAVGVALVVGVRRPRSLEDELKQPVPAPPVGAAPPGQAPAGHAPLVATIRALARERATGKLEVTSGDRSCSLYFLFGHLFHAESGSFQGEDALQAALAWGQTSSEIRSERATPQPGDVFAATRVAVSLTASFAAPTGGAARVAGAEDRSDRRSIPRG